MIDKIYQKIKRDLRVRANPYLAKKYEVYHKKPGHIQYGILTPELRKLIKEYRPEMLKLALSERKKLAMMLYRSKYAEEAIFGNDILAKSIILMKPKDLIFFDKVFDYFTSWGRTDDFCSNILQPILLKYTDETLKLLKRWNRSKNIWKRRASVVAFTRKIGESGKFAVEGLKMCQNLINDKEDLVQKGVGWALKDLMRGDKKKVLDFVKKLRKQGVSSTITLYALRDIKGVERNKIVKIVLRSRLSK